MQIVKKSSNNIIMFIGWAHKAKDNFNMDFGDSIIR